jgi:hypothetical protein
MFIKITYQPPLNLPGRGDFLIAFFKALPTGEGLGGAALRLAYAMAAFIFFTATARARVVSAYFLLYAYRHLFLLLAGIAKIR